jgi:hypothetical protein
MLLHGHVKEETKPPRGFGKAQKSRRREEPQTTISRLTMELELAKLHAKGMEAKVESLIGSVAEATAKQIEAERDAEKWREWSDNLQSLAAEGKDPLTGAAPQLWIVWRSPSKGNADWFAKAESKVQAVEIAEQAAASTIGCRYYILPAFTYAICEVSPVTWKTAGKAAQEEDSEIPF